MKCVCGYEYEEEYVEKVIEQKNKQGKIMNPLKKWVFQSVKGDEKFIYIKGTFFREGNGYYHDLIETSLYACPKCSTVRMSTD